MYFLFRLLVITITINLLVYSNSYACSSFQLRSEDNTYHGKSYDWTFGDGYIIYNPSHLQKSSLSLSPNQKKIQWTSQYANITFNQYGLDFPNGGINEQGLSVEVLWLDTSIYPPKDDKAVFNELQWIQYVLDTQNSTEGVVKTLKTVRIEPIYAKVHYFVCDNQKNCATVEFVNGKATIGTYEKYGYEVITNSTHKDSIRHLGLYKNFGGTKDITWGTYATLERFARINELLRTYNQEFKMHDPIAYSFKSLDTVKRDKIDVGSYTQWQIVYDKLNLVSYFKTTFSNTAMGNVALKSFPTDCTTRYYFDMKNETRGDIGGEFKPLSMEANYTLVKTSLRKVMPNAPEDMIKAISGAPFQFKCTQ